MHKFVRNKFEQRHAGPKGKLQDEVCNRTGMYSQRVPSKLYGVLAAGSFDPDCGNTEFKFYKRQ